MVITTRAHPRQKQTLLTPFFSQRGVREKERGGRIKERQGKKDSIKERNKRENQIFRDVRI